MPVSKKPRGAGRVATGPNPFTAAGTLVYSWYENAVQRKLAGPTMEEVTRRARTGNRRTRRHLTKFAGRGIRSTLQRDGIGFAACDPAGSRPAERRKRQKLTQHPSVVARFANPPTQEQIRQAEAKTGIVAKVKRAVTRKPKAAVA